MTTAEKKAVSHLVEHEMALKVYLDSLLFDETETETEVVEEQQVVPESVVAAPVVTPQLDDVDLEIQLKGLEQGEKVIELVTPTPEIKEEQAAEVPEVERPGWSDATFECLMFKVAGSLTLSVPLVHLSGILTWQDEVTPMPGHAEWFLGLLQSRGKQVKVIDIAKFVIPQNHKARESLEQEREFKHIVLIDDGRFGLACDGLGDVLKLNKEQVRWRGDRSSRPWLAGTVIDQMCALIDIDRFVDMLKEGGVPDDIS